MAAAQSATTGDWSQKEHLGPLLCTARLQQPLGKMQAQMWGVFLSTLDANAEQSCWDLPGLTLSLTSSSLVIPLSFLLEEKREGEHE